MTINDLPMIILTVVYFSLTTFMVYRVFIYDFFKRL